MDINNKAINELKSIIAETISNAKSGHTGTAIGATSICYALFKDHLVFNPNDTRFLNRDRFVLSAGHASALLYCLLHMFGFNITADDLKNFRKYGSKTPGHPEYNLDIGIETTTGPLGQGVANAVGLAISEKIFEARFNTPDINLFNNYTYCFAGDGCLMEGVAVEACSLAGTLKLNKLILLYDDNNITISGEKTLANTEDTALKFKAMGWNIIIVNDGNNYLSCTKAIQSAKQSDKPTIIIFKTIIGLGTRHQGSCKVHSYPLPENELLEFKKSLNVSTSFEFSKDILDIINSSVVNKIEIYNRWNMMLSIYKQNYPEKFTQLTNIFKTKKHNYSKLLQNLNLLPPSSGRDYSGIILTELSKTYPELIGGTADLGTSTKAVIQDAGYFSPATPLGKNIHFGVREHAMGSICNGIALYAGLPVFDSTFLSFSNYMLPSILMRAIMNIPTLSIFSHDSIDIGEDGITHQPISQLGSLRSIVNLATFRPANYSEIVAGYKYFLENKAPTALILSKSKLVANTKEPLENIEKGAYVIFQTNTKPTIQIFATGKEVELAIEVAKNLEKVGARVISMPCESLFDKQNKIYKNKILLQNPTLNVAIEASNDNIWYKYIGQNGLLINVNSYQTSAPGNDVYQKAGFNIQSILKNISKAYKKLIDF